MTTLKNPRSPKESLHRRLKDPSPLEPTDYFYLALCAIVLLKIISSI